MAHQSESARLQALFEPALHSYEKKAGVSLAQHPLAIKLQTCESVEAITGLLQDQAQAFMHLQGSDKVLESIKMVVSILFKISSTVSLADAFRMVRQNGLMTCLGFLNSFYRHSHPRGRYRLVSLSYLTYVPFFSYSYIGGLMPSI